MNTGTVSVLVVESDPLVRRQLGEAIGGAQDLRLAGLCHDARTAVVMARQTRADVLLLELDLPQIDGFYVLEQLAGQPYAGAVVAHTRLCGERVIQRAFTMGAAYFLLKPFDTPLLLRRVKEAGQKRRLVNTLPVAAAHGDDYATCAARLLDALGMPPHLLGYGYFRDGIAAILRNMQLMKRLTTQLYPMLARQHATTPARVERAMRHAVEVLWMRGNLAQIDRLFGDSVATDKGKPTSGEFMARLADALKLDIL